MAQSTLSIRRASSAAGSKKVSSFRPDIQGLRAIAVLVVILDHMFGLPRGGFVGVDVFFVISGFVITGSMLRDHERQGRISFAGFYRHRARRILPAAVVVLTATIVASWFTFLGERARSVLWDGIWAALFGANWRFAATGTDYLQASGPTSPLQHYWSLSVEEQFYFIWPALLVVVLTVVANRRGWSTERARRVLGLTILAITAGSLVFAYWETVSAPTVAYFSTFSRAWELAIGALIAVAIPLFARIPAAVRPVLQWIGLAGIVSSLFLVDTETPFPAPGALLPVVSTAIVILGGVGGQRFMGVLTNKVSRYIGDISYSLYLWHFPVIILTKALFPSTTIIQYLSMVALIIMLSVASYHFVEDRIRKSNWLEPRNVRRNDHGNLNKMSFGTKMLGLSLLTVAALGIGTIALTKTMPVQVQAGPIPTVTFGSSSSATSEPATALAGLQSKVAFALQAREWPTLKPSLDELGNQAWAPEIVNDGCLSIGDSNYEKCVYGDSGATKTVALVGDSIAASWMPAIRAALDGAGYRIQMLTQSGCPAFDVQLKSSAAAACADHRTWTANKLRDLNPSLILVSQAYEDNVQTDGKAPQEQATAWKEAGTRFVNTLPGGSSIAFLEVPKGGKNLTECATRASTPADCISDVNAFGEMIEKANSDAIIGAASASRKATYVETQNWFCDGSKRCPSFIGSTPVRIDSSHLTGVFSKSLGPVLAEAMAPILNGDAH
ncbi:acyltransferase family protein [Arthrobacter bambusae]